MPNNPGTVLFPTQLDDADSLIRAANNAATTLSTGISSTATTISVPTTASFPPSGALTIDGEILFYVSKDMTTFTLSSVANGRGQDGTAAAAHTAGTGVEGLIIAAHHNSLASALVAVETKLGIGSSTPTNGTLLQGTTVVGTSAWSNQIYLNGVMGIGAAVNPNSIALSVGRIYTNNALDAGTSYYYGLYSSVTTALTATSVSGWRAYASLMTIQVTGSYNNETIVGGRYNVYHSGTGTVTYQHGAQFLAGSAVALGTATSTNVTAGQFLAIKSGAGTWSVASLRMVEITTPSFSAGTLSGTTLCGLYVGDFSLPSGSIGTWTTKYAIFAAGGNSYHVGNFGIGGNNASTPNSPLHVAGSIATAIVSTSSNYPLTSSDSIVLASGTINITLPSAVGIAGRQYTIKKTDSGTTTSILTTSGQTIDGAAPTNLTTQWAQLSVVSDGSNWIKV